MRVQRSLWIAVSSCLLASVAPLAAHAVPPEKPAVQAIGHEEHARQLQAALVALESSDPLTIQNALLSLKQLQGRSAAEAIVARLKLGMPPLLAETAISVLAELNQPIAVPVLAELTLHRRWQIRERAVTALAALRVRSSVSVLLYALDDPSPEVRSAAARALGMVGDPRARPALTAALARGVDGALEGLAQLATSAQVDGILGRAGSDLRASEPALWVLLARPNLPPVTKLKVIHFVQSHGAEQEAGQVLALWRDKLKSGGDVRLLPALAETPHTTGPASVAKTQVQTTVVTETKLAEGRVPASKAVKP